MGNAKDSPFETTHKVVSSVLGLIALVSFVASLFTKENLQAACAICALLSLVIVVMSNVLIRHKDEEIKSLEKDHKAFCETVAKFVAFYGFKHEAGHVVNERTPETSNPDLVLAWGKIKEDLSKHEDLKIFVKSPPSPSTPEVM